MKKLMEVFFDPDRLPFYMVFIMLLFWFIFNLHGNKLPVNGGLGWDGVSYASWTPRSVLHSVCTYYSARIFPSLAVFYVIKLFSIAHINIGIVTAFYIYDLAVLSIGLYFFVKISRLQKWPFSVFLLGFAAIFINFNVLRQVPYVPVSTDSTALALGVGLIYCYLAGRNLWLVILSLIASFTFPVLPIIGYMFLLFPYKTQEKCLFKINALVISSKRAAMAISIILALIYSIISAYLFWSLDSIPKVSLSGFWNWANSFSYSYVVAVISLCFYFIYNIFLVKSFVSKKIVIPVVLIRWVIVFIIILIVHFVKVHFIIDPTAISPLTPKAFFINLFTMNLQGPLSTLTPYFIFYGPPMLLVMISWKKIVEQAVQLGTGMILVLIMLALFSFDSEARELMPFLGFIIFLLCEVSKEYNIRFSYLILLFSLTVSRLWCPFPSSASAFSNYATLPTQIVFMTSGRYTSNFFYLVQTLIFIVAFYVIYRMSKSSYFLNKKSSD